MDSLNEKLKTISGIEYRPQIDLARFTTMKLKATGSVIIVKSIEALKNTLNLLNQNKVDYILLGWGANQIFAQVEKKILIKLDFALDQKIFESVQREYRLPASTPLNLLTSHAMKFGLKGWEVFTGVPASLGGAIYMNAGTNLGEIGILVREVTLMRKSGSIETLSITQKSFSYRKNHFVGPGDVILEVVLSNHGVDETIPEKIRTYLKLRQDTQPLSEYTCGCVFKNDSKFRAGQAIDLCGLKGFMVNGVRVSHKHANFMENFEEGQSADFYQLKNLIIDELYLNFGIKFELEVKIS